MFKPVFNRSYFKYAQTGAKPVVAVAILVKFENVDPLQLFQRFFIYQLIYLSVTIQIQSIINIMYQYIFRRSIPHLLIVAFKNVLFNSFIYLYSSAA